MSRLPDLVRDSRLDTEFNDGYTIHHFDESDDEDDNKQAIRRTEYWKKEKVLGRGGCGEVILQQCVQRSEGPSRRRERAVKAISRPDIGSNYVEELEALAKFSQRRYRRYFVELLGWYETESEIFIAMEYFPFGDLQRYISSAKNPQPESDVREILSQTLRGLHFMHEEGFSHRDIKPGNILIKAMPPSRSWRVKLADFGISKRLESTMHLLSTFKGTMGYVAPELLYHEPGRPYRVDVRASDMWSLGEMAFRMLTTTSTFASPFALNSYLARPDTFPLHRLQECDASKDMAELISCLMKPAPENRISSAQALVMLQSAETQSQELPDATINLPMITSTVASSSSLHIQDLEVTRPATLLTKASPPVRPDVSPFHSTPPARETGSTIEYESLTTIDTSSSLPVSKLPGRYWNHNSSSQNWPTSFPR